MEGEGDSFLKSLQKRQRNLTKKLDRIKKKQAEVKSSGKDMKEEEKKLIESAPQIEEFLLETDKLITQYKQHLDSNQKTEKKAPVKEDDRSKEVASLWVLGEFLSNQQVKEKFVKENPADVQDLDAFLLLHSSSRGQTGKKFNEILSEVEKSVELFLAKSDKVAPGTMRTYKKLSEFAAKAQTWASAVTRPQTPVKTEVVAQPGPAHPTQHTGDVRAAPEETKVETQVVKEVKEVKETREVREVKETHPVRAEPVNESTAKKWADDEDDDWADEPKAAKHEESKKVNEDDGFITVTGRKPKGQKPEGERQDNRPRGGFRGDRRGDRRGHGRRGGRGRGEGEGEAHEGEAREPQEFRGERRRGGRRGGRQERGDRPPRDNAGDGEVRE